MPVGLNRSKKAQRHFDGLRITVDCTKMNIWGLQLLHTKRALEAAGVKIDESRILHVYDRVDKDKKKRIHVDEHAPPDWTNKI